MPWIRGVGVNEAEGDLAELSACARTRASLVTAYFNFVNQITLGLGVGFSAEEVEGYKV